MVTIAGRPVNQVRISKPGPSGPAGPTQLSEVYFTGPSLILDASHAGKVVIMNAATAQTVTVPAGIWAGGEQALFVRAGAGTVEFVDGSGPPIILSEGGMRKIAAIAGQAALQASAFPTPGYFLAGRLGV